MLMGKEARRGPIQDRSGPGNTNWGEIRRAAEAEVLVSAQSTGTWSNINRETNELFSCSPKDMIRKCANFAARTRGMRPEEKKGEYFAFFMEFVGA